MKSISPFRLMAVIASLGSPLVAESPKSVSVLEFGEAGNLFVADSKGAQIYSYQLPSGDVDPPSKPKPYNILDLKEKIEEILKLEPGASLQVKDLAVHPVSKEAFLSLSVEQNGKVEPAIVRINQDGSGGYVDLSVASGSSYKLGESADPGVTFWRDIPATSLTVTDLDFADGKLYVSGLSTGEFASTLRIVPFPFNGEGMTSTLEMYHTSHSHNETRAPIRALSIVDLKGVPSVVAAYTCSPMVTFPISDLADGKHVTVKTVAELGYGNTPVEVLSFSEMNMKQEPVPVVLVLSKNMGARLFNASDIAKADAITEGTAALGHPLGVSSRTIPMSGVLQAADQDQQFLLTVRRDFDTGNLQLVSYRKGSYMRLSDFISEYNFPDYTYGDTKVEEFTKQFQNTLKADEGFDELIKQ